MDIVLVSATHFETGPVVSLLQQEFEGGSDGTFRKGDLTVRPLITGVGMVSTSWQLGCFLALNRPGLIINAGIAGSFDPNLEIGSVVHVISERFGDLGVEEADGRFTDLHEMGFGPEAAPWWQNGRMVNEMAAEAAFLPRAHGLTVNKVHGAKTSIEVIRNKYPDVQVESMEGAAFFYACLQAGVPFLEIRSISNKVEPRNRAAWDLPGAIANLNKVLWEVLDGGVSPFTLPTP
jgi:futalosine hydrolase